MYYLFLVLTFCNQNSTNNPKQKICVASNDEHDMTHNLSFKKRLNNYTRQIFVLTRFYQSTTKKLQSGSLKNRSYIHGYVCLIYFVTTFV